MASRRKPIKVSGPELTPDKVAGASQISARKRKETPAWIRFGSIILFLSGAAAIAVAICAR